MFSEPDDRPKSRDIVFVPQPGTGARPPTSLIQPSASIPTKFDTGYEWVPVKPRPRWGRLLLSGAARIVQLMAASFAGVVMYVAFLGPDDKIPWRSTAFPRTGAVAQIPPATAIPSTPGIDVMKAARAELAKAMSESAKLPSLPYFPLPSSYGIYAISDDQLIDIDQVQTSPVRPARQEHAPDHDARPDRHRGCQTFIHYLSARHDFQRSRQDPGSDRGADCENHDFRHQWKSCRRAAANARAGSFAIVGYDLRVAPLPQSQEMVLARPQDQDFVRARPLRTADRGPTL